MKMYVLYCVHIYSGIKKVWAPLRLSNIKFT